MAQTKWKTKKIPQRDDRLRHVVLEKSSGFVSAESPSTMQHVIHSKSVFAASEVAISHMNAKHPLWEKQTSGPAVQYNLQEANNSEFVATNPEENGCSVELDCADFNCVEVDLACATPVMKYL